MALREEPPSDTSLDKRECKNHDGRKMPLLKTRESFQEENLRKFAVLKEVKIILSDLASDPHASMICTDLRQQLLAEDCV